VDLSREGAFLLKNLVLVALAFVIWWGTFFPLISEALSGKKASVGPPWFDRYTVPLALMLVLLAGIGPILTWRKVSVKALRRTLVVPLVVSAVVFLGLLAFTDASDSWPSLVMFTLIAFVI